MKRVCIQGLGFVGAAMSVAVASARCADGSPRYFVTGVDQASKSGKTRVDDINGGRFPFRTPDQKLISALETAHTTGNLGATIDESVYESADIVVIDVSLDIPFQDKEPEFQMTSFKQAIRSVGKRVPPGALVLVETTVPPGTCEKIVAPILADELGKRGLEDSQVHLAHSFERVMPGADYLDSITGIWRAYAGQTEAAADKCEEFLETIVDVDRFPLSRLSSMTATEVAKVMENTYRAVNIALIDEWTKYAEAIGVDLFEVLEAIRLRPTHSNIRFPGLGVGGYCLSKDSAFAPAAARQLHKLQGLKFPFSRLAMKVNQDMPLHAVDKITQLMDGNCKGKSVLVLGLSYRQDIGDTRFSPAEKLVRTLENRGTYVGGYDPFLDYWPEMDWTLPSNMPGPDRFDAIVFATPHDEFRSMNLLKWLGMTRPVVLDAANVISKHQRDSCRKVGVRIESIGRGNGL